LQLSNLISEDLIYFKNIQKERKWEESTIGKTKKQKTFVDRFVTPYRTIFYNDSLVITTK